MEALRLAIDVGPVGAGGTDSRGVDERRNLGEVGVDDGKEKSGVGLAEGAEVDVLLEVVGLRPELLERPHLLKIE